MINEKDSIPYINMLGNKKYYSRDNADIYGEKKLNLDNLKCIKTLKNVYYAQDDLDKALAIT